jgi:hypothetical protein
MNYNESIRDVHDIWTRIKTKIDESKHDISFCASTSFGPCNTNPCKEEEENDRWRPNDESTSPRGLSSHFDSHMCCVANEYDSGSTNEDEEEERSFNLQDSPIHPPLGDFQIYSFSHYLMLPQNAQNKI